MAATTPFSKIAFLPLCHSWAGREVGRKQENGSGSACLEQAELFLNKNRLMRLVSGNSPEQPTLYRGSIFSAQALLSALLCSGNPEDLITQLRESIPPFNGQENSLNLRLSHLREGKLTAYQQIMLHPGQRAGVYGWRRTSFAGGAMPREISLLIVDDDHSFKTVLQVRG